MLSGCATGNKFTESQKVEGQATVYFYRLSKIVGSGTYPNIYVNDEKREALLNGSYLSFHLYPGKYRFKADGNFIVYPFKKVEIQMEIEANKEYFIRFDPDLGDINVLGDVLKFDWDNKFFLMEESHARAQIQDLKANN